MNNKAIFLDIDGVILPGFHTAGSFDPGACDRVVQLANKHKADIILSSDWRMSWERLGLENFIRMNSGVDLRIKEFLPVSEFLSRGEEIRSFLSNDENKHYEYVVILDDLPVCQFDTLEAHLVNTVYEVGFTGDDFSEADRLLGVRYSGEWAGVNDDKDF